MSGLTRPSSRGSNPEPWMFTAAPYCSIRRSGSVTTPQGDVGRLSVSLDVIGNLRCRRLNCLDVSARRVQSDPDGGVRGPLANNRNRPMMTTALDVELHRLPTLRDLES